MVYRRRKSGSDTWHYSTNCHLWPTSNYDERRTRPSDGELCNHCKGKENQGNCQTRD